ncbi:CDP-diacylglycerol diphosphatase [Mycolicibacterium agri]|uniref:CDP-diacylglycerol diphosphatase n=1 Tax=Mycolicibacterium agri TaxID=36811 RepID=A0A2A7NF75_MYCAG|nr:CDP-diacylglycerol diphosphatase [Mycolicibacterium agri]
MRHRRLAAALAVVLALVAAAPPAAADPNALWSIVAGQCVPDQRQHADPAPCALVTGTYAVLKDIVGATQYLLIPTARITGIEDPQILTPDAPNYFADAWRARTFVEERAGRELPRDWLSLAVNSAATRTQNQLHIHIDCVRADVHDALAAHADDIGPTWTPFPVLLAGQPYRAMAVPGAELTVNPFRLLADGLTPGQDMGQQTLVVVGGTAADGAERFILLDGHFDGARPGSGSGEDLQDHAACPPRPESAGK